MIRYFSAEFHLLQSVVKSEYLLKIKTIFSHCLVESIVHQISGQLNIFDKATRSTAKNRNSNNSPKYQPLSCNPNLRLYKYAKGQSFGRHFDGASDIQFVSGSPYSKANVKEAQTEMTVLFYLSSCRGGATRFHLPHGKNVFGGGNGKKKCNGFDGSVAFVPEEGAVLLHVHGDRCLEHEAEPVRDGIKYGKFIHFMPCC